MLSHHFGKEAFMKIREIKWHVRREVSCLSPAVLAISAGVTVFLGILVHAGLPPRLSHVCLPRTSLPSFLYILFQLFAYAIYGGGFAFLLSAPGCGCLPKKKLEKYALLLFAASVLVLSFSHTHLVFRAGSRLLGLLLSAVILLFLCVLIFTTKKQSFLASCLFTCFAGWECYLFYLTLRLLFFG